MEESKDLLETMLKHYYGQNMISKIISTEVKSGSSKGDNYTSIIKRVNMEVILKSGKKKTKSIIIKQAFTTEFTKDFLAKMGLFPKEIEVYNHILPTMEDIMIEFGDYTEPMWGKCLDYRPFDTIFFEDLEKYGYLMASRKDGLDLEHCSLVMRSLAKFHTASLILNRRGLINMEIFGKHLYQNESTKAFFDKACSHSIENLIEFMEKLWEPEWQVYVKKLRTEIAPKAAEMLRNLVRIDEDGFNVLCHGDCWVNNMLFKYGLDKETPISVKFVDFQITYYNNPAFDLKYFLSTSPNLDVRRNSVDKLIKLYHETLINELDYYKYDGKRITLDSLFKELERIDFFGLATSLSILPIILVENAEEMPDMEEMIKKATAKENPKFDFNPYELTTPVFTTIIKDTLKNYMDKNSNLKF